MSLTDSLLLDPVAPPRVDVWIASRTDGVEDAPVENNVVDLAIANPIRHHYCTTVHYFNKTNSVGQLIQGSLQEPPGAGVTPVKQDELATQIEDASVLSIV